MEITIKLQRDDIAAVKNLLAQEKLVTEIGESEKRVLKNMTHAKSLTIDDLLIVQRILKLGRSTDACSLRLHELVQRSRVQTPSLPKLERNPELEARCERLRAEQANREYRDMTRNVDAHTAKESPLSEIGREIRAINRHLVTLFNMLFTVVGSFLFAYFGTQYMYPSGPGAFASRLGAGLITGTVVFFADLYFVIRTLDEEAYDRKKTK